MENRKLTNYDLFLLKKQEEAKNAASGASVCNSAYEDYLIRELRRTAPSTNKVMTEDEFNRTEKPARSHQGVAARAKNPSNVKKMGLIFLVMYVIIVLALALIVLVNTKGDAIIPGADASAVEEGTIQVMPLDEEQEPESENWFDSLCDSLNN